MSFHALEVVLPLLGRLAVLVQPLLALLALRQQRHLAAVLVLPRQVPRHQRRRVRLPQTLNLALLNKPMQKMNSMELLMDPLERGSGETWKSKPTFSESLLPDLALEALQLVAERQPLALQHVQDRVVLLLDGLTCDDGIDINRL